MPIPVLLRRAHGRYGTAIRAALAEAGCDDVPRSGVTVIGAVARTGAPLREIIEDLGVSKQAAGQLVDTLVARGYLDRTVDPDDRRRLRINLAERGVEAAKIIRAAVEELDRAWQAGLAARDFQVTRRALGTLLDLGR